MKYSKKYTIPNGSMYLNNPGTSETFSLRLNLLLPTFFSSCTLSLDFTLMSAVVVTFSSGLGNTAQNANAINNGMTHIKSKAFCSPSLCNAI